MSNKLSSSNNNKQSIFTTNSQYLQNKLSSCDCYNCANNLYLSTKNYANNCDFSPYFECENKLFFKNQIEPNNKNGSTFLNPTNISKSYASDFYAIDCSKSPIGNFNGIGYSSTDPRLISSMHNGQVLVLDKPPIDENIKLKNVYTDPRLKYYGQKYNDYRDINSGQILYYVYNSYFQIQM